MAKPLNTISDTPYSTLIFSEPISFPGRATKKRTHNYSDDGIDDDSQKTRRVNPQRLAARLGPGIVAEMEALIYPGAKMPSFEVRRVLQERYSVDRRHIYDYFHSRGLRVAKEDRHLNLTRGRLSKALERQTAEKVRNHSLALLRAAFYSFGNYQPSSDALSDTTCSTEKADRQPEENQQLANTERDSLVETQIASASTIKRPIVNHTEILGNTEQLSTRNAKLVAAGRITGQPPSPCPVFALADNASDILCDDLSLSSYFESSELFLGLCDVTESPFNDYGPKTPSIIEEHRALTQAERQELYNFINDNIGVSSGIMEQAGTYTAHMKERTQHYFDRILSQAHYATRIFPETHDGLLFDSSVSADDVDFRNWLSDYDQDLDENCCTDSFYYSGDPWPHEGKAISNILPQHGSAVRDLVMQKSERAIFSSHPSNLESSVTENTQFGPLHYDYTVDLPTRAFQSPLPDKPADRSAESQTLHSSFSHHRRHNTRLRLTPFVQKTTTQNSDVSMSNGLSEISNPFPDYNNRLFLHISRPRLRTSSAGGGL
ncbi:hypothetical protein J132_04839 [Termitomyces sp. J132]|nr:hypothetical protein J132_04839 [Termitomyces sp. J132]